MESLEQLKVEDSGGTQEKKEFDPQKKRLPMQPTKIGELPEKGRIVVIGTVVDFSEGSIVIDDGTGSIVGRISENTIRENEPQKGSLVRAIGRLQDKEMLTEIIQDFSGFDVASYDTAAKMYQEVVQ